jgi:hypothetical protein
MQRVAAVWRDAANLSIHLSDEAARPELLQLGATYDPGLDVWTAAPVLLEPVCSLLDRAGYVWAVDHRDAPRTWAERVCAELPPRALHFVAPHLLWLFDSLGEHDHAAVLRHAWREAFGDAIEPAFGAELGQPAQGPGTA